MSDIHPGSWVGDSVEEFKKLPTWGKFLAVGALGLAGYLGYNAYQSSKANASSAASTTGTAAIGGSTDAGTQSPFPSVNGLPLLPSNVNPVFDSGGNPIAYQQAPTPTGSTGTGSYPPSNPPTPTGNPKPPTTPVAPVSTGGGGPLIPYGTYKGPSFSNLKPGTHYTYNGVNYLLNTGPNGKLYGTNPQGHQILLYGPQSDYPRAGSDAPHYHTMWSFMTNPQVYLVSAKPHTPASVMG